MVARFHLQSFAIILIIVLFGAALYLPALDLLLFWDDVPHMQWLATQPNGGYWLTSAGFPFYRPSTFAVWDVLYHLYGYHNARLLHALSLMLHIANACLVAFLARRLTHQPRAALWAGILFVAFPFSYQTIIPAAAHFHLWLVFGLLASTWWLLDWLESGGKWRLGLAWLLSFWAIFSHENGILIPFLMGGLLAVYCLQQNPALRDLPWRRVALALAPVGGLAAFYGLLWVIVPKANDTGDLQLAALDVKIGQTLQALGFPFAALFRHAINPRSPTMLTWISGLVMIALVALKLLGNPLRSGSGGSMHSSALDSNKAKLSINYFLPLTLLWIPLVMLPAWLLLDVNYLLGSPRLHYLASVGMAWLWGILFENFLRTGRQRWSVSVSGVTLCLVIAVPFIRARLVEHRTIDRLYRETAAVFATSSTLDEHFLLVNGPAYLAPRGPTFLLGAEGSTYLPDFINLRDWLLLNRYPAGALADNRQVADITPASDTIFSVTHPALDRTSIRYYDRVAVVVRLDGDLHTVIAGTQLYDESATLVPPLADFGNGVILQSAAFSPTHPVSNTLRLDLDWQVESALSSPVGVFVHLLCDGRLIAQADGPPLGRVYPFELWQVGERWQDSRYFELDAGQQEGCLQAFIGLYDPVTAQRLTIIDSDDNSTDGVLIPY